MNDEGVTLAEFGALQIVERYDDQPDARTTYRPTDGAQDAEMLVERYADGAEGEA